MVLRWEGSWSLEQAPQRSGHGTKPVGVSRSIRTTLLILWFSFRWSCEEQGVRLDWSLPTWDVLWYPGCRTRHTAFLGLVRGSGWKFALSTSLHRLSDSAQTHPQGQSHCLRRGESGRQGSARTGPYLPRLASTAMLERQQICLQVCRGQPGTRGTDRLMATQGCPRGKSTEVASATHKGDPAHTQQRKGTKSVRTLRNWWEHLSKILDCQDLHHVNNATVVNWGQPVKLMKSSGG